MSETSSESPSISGRFRRRTILVLAGVLAVTATIGGWGWWHARRPSQRFARALAAVDAQRFDQVQRELEALEDTPGYTVQCHFLRGVLLLRQERFFPALNEFGHAVDDPTLRVRTLVLSGEALYRVQDFRAAIGLFVQVLSQEPDSLDAHRWLAAAYYDLGLTTEALQHMVRVSELDPSDARPHRLMGLIQKDFENYAAAVKSYRESLRRNPQQPDRQTLLLELAECQLKLHQLQDALTSLAECPPSPNRWALEAECHYGRGDVAEARRRIEQTLEAAPANLRALFLHGTIFLDEGNAEAAVKVLSQAAAAYPKDYTVRFKLGRAYRRLGDSQNADEQGRIADDIKRVRLQFSKLHETAASEPNNADVRRQLAILANQLDRPDLARVWFQAALAINPKLDEPLPQASGQPQAEITRDAKDRP